jgi:UDP-GlcNAc:undecaprenyl-phosphate GlcNAc-1-phosphate transferase
LVSLFYRILLNKYKSLELLEKAETFVRAVLTTLLALIITALFVEVTRRIAPAVGLVDSPDERKAHDGEIPLVGGIAIFFALLMVLTAKGVLSDYGAFFFSAGILTLIGVSDDAIGISPLLRLFCQAGAVFLIATFGGTYIADLGNILPAVGLLSLGWMAVPFTVFAGVGVINAFNMSDGVDGLCGTLTLIALTGLGIAAGVAGKHGELMLIMALIGGVIGFLMFNIRLPQREQARVFLGDAGSYLLGLSVLYLAIRLSQGPDRAIAPVTALWFCMVPLLDTIGMILRRVRRGQSPFRADREHLHHVFLLAEFSVTTTWVGLAAAATIGMLVGLIGHLSGLPESLMFAGFMIVGVLYYQMMNRVWRALRFLSRSINRRKMAKIDRRTGKDRRKNDIGFFVDGIRVERRSGQDRRNGNGDRRINEDSLPATISGLKQSNNLSQPTGKAARVS